MIKMMQDLRPEDLFEFLGIGVKYALQSRYAILNSENKGELYVFIGIEKYDDGARRCWFYAPKFGVCFRYVDDNNKVAIRS